MAEWRHSIQVSPAPWGELATDNIILTVPTENLRTLEDPEPVLRLWDKMMEAIARLAAQPFPFHRPERIVADVQISAGMCPAEAITPRLTLPFKFHVCKKQTYFSRDERNYFLVEEVRVYIWEVKGVG